VSIYVAGADAQVVGNIIDRATPSPGSWGQAGIALHGPRSVAQFNDVSDMNYGIRANVGGADADRIVVRDNQVHDNAAHGIDVQGAVEVRNNTVFGNDAVGITGWEVYEIANNVAYGNQHGLSALGTFRHSRITGNRAFGNLSTGILTGMGTLAHGNIVYSNPIGIQVGCCGYYNAAQITNNLVYANTEHGISVGDSSGVRLVNNTIHQTVGDAIRITANSSNLVIKNNILTVGAGYGLNFLSASHANRTWDYNLFHRLVEAQANVAFWAGAPRATLPDWQTASGQESHSVAAAAGFVDINGADDVLALAAGNDYDGGLDDNFNLAAGSAAIDRADASVAPATDRAGFGRSDDPTTPNLGTPDGTFVDLGAHEFQGSSSDIQPPRILAVTPAAIDASGRVLAFDEIVVATSEPMNLIDALAVANYELRSSGPNRLFGDGDDVVVPILPTYQAGSTQITLRWAAANLPDGDYRIVISATGGLRDTAGIALDGDDNGTAGGAYLRLFAIGAAAGDFNRDGRLDARDIDQLHEAIAAASTNALYDLTGDGTVDTADVQFLVSDLLGTQSGDANLDGRIDRNDARILASYFGQTGAPDWASGDFDGDGNIGLADLAHLQRNFSVAAGSAVAGEFSGHGAPGAADIDALMDEAEKAAPSPAFELTGDGSVDAADVKHLVENVLHTRFGDANLDGHVNRIDAAIIALSLGRGGGSGWATGDFDGDGRVTVLDLDRMQRNLATASPSAAAGARTSTDARPGAPILHARRRPAPGIPLSASSIDIEGVLLTLASDGSRKQIRTDCPRKQRLDLRS
jgi:parallel beta-helix repeat protein